MTQTKTKKALLMSVLSMVLCVAMLVGMTFAWFTDTASTSVNKIQAGTLDVQIVGANNDTELTDALKWTQKVGDGLTPLEDGPLWEPGVTFRTEGFRIKNNGNLALKFKIGINKGVKGETDAFDLRDVIDFFIVTKVGDGYEAVDVDAFEGKLTGAADSTYSPVYYLQGHMKESAGNDYQGKTLNDIAISVVATQMQYESDSNGNDYDKDAAYPTYPAGITKDSFKANNKAVDDNGNFYESFEAAMENVEDGGSLYIKEDSTVDFPTHLNVTKNINIYANGTDFSGKDISIGTYAAPEKTETTINIRDAKNLVVWGQPTANLSDNCTWNVNFTNCENDGYNFLMYRGGDAATAKINLTLTNCKATGFSDSIVHTTADGSIVIKNCVFNDNCAPVNIAHKQSGIMDVTVENSQFNNCGKVDTDNDYFAPARFVNNSATGTLNVKLTNNTFKGTIGTNGDILLGDYREGKASHALTAEITTTTPVMVKSSTAAAYSYSGGTITLNN